MYVGKPRYSESKPNEKSKFRFVQYAILVYFEFLRRFLYNIMPPGWSQEVWEERVGHGEEMSL